MTNEDWIKRTHVDFYMQVNQTWEYIDPVKAPGRLESFGYPGISKIHEWINGEFREVLEAYRPVYALWENPATRTALMTPGLVKAEETVKPVYRELYGFFKGNRFVSDNDLQAMAMPRRAEGGRSPVPVPSGVPHLDIYHPSEGVVEVHFKDKRSVHRAKPRGVHGVEFLWGLLDRPPVSRDELTRGAFDTRTPYRFVFGIEEVGKSMYIAARWENTRGAKGPWSELYQTMIS
jgi:hypothetical protein